MCTCKRTCTHLPMCVCIYIYTHINKSVYIYTHTFRYTYVHIPIYVYIYISVYTFKYMYVCVCSCTDPVGLQQLCVHGFSTASQIAEVAGGGSCRRRTGQEQGLDPLSNRLHFERVEQPNCTQCGDIKQRTPQTLNCTPVLSPKTLASVLSAPRLFA